MLIVASAAFRRAHARRRAIPSGRSAPTCSTAVAAAFARRGGEVRRAACRRRARSWRASTRAAYLDAIAATAGRAAMLDPDTFTSPESHEVALPGRRRRDRGGAPRLRHAASRRSRWCGRRATTPSPIGRWASASTTTSRWRPPRCAPTASTASRSSTSTCITATARRPRSTTIRPCCSSRAISIRTTRAPARPTRPATGAGAGFTLNLPLAAGATDDAIYERVYAIAVVPALEAFAPDVILVSAGFDAHELRSARPACG